MRTLGPGGNRSVMWGEGTSLTCPAWDGLAHGGLDWALPRPAPIRRCAAWLDDRTYVLLNQVVFGGAVVRRSARGLGSGTPMWKSVSESA